MTTSNALSKIVSPIPEEWLVEKPPERKFLIDKVLPLGIVGFLVGAGGDGKSMLVVLLALAVTTGVAWLGLQVSHPGCVLLLLAEEDAEEARRRIFYAAQVLGLTPDERALVAERLVLLPLSGHDAALTASRRSDAEEASAAAQGLPATQFFDQLVNFLQERGPFSLVVLDPLARIAGPDVERDNSVATRAIQIFERFTAIEGRPTVLVVHHSNKGGRSDPRKSQSDASAASIIRGSTGLTDGSRFQANLSARKTITGTPQLVELRFVKSNYGEKAADIILVRDTQSHGVLRRATPEEIAAGSAPKKSALDVTFDLVGKIVALLREASTPMSTDEIRKAVGRGMTTVAAALKKAEADGLVRREKHGNRSAGWVACRPDAPDAPEKTDSD